MLFTERYIGVHLPYTYFSAEKNRIPINDGKRRVMTLFPFLETIKYECSCERVHCVIARNFLFLLLFDSLPGGTSISCLIVLIIAFNNFQVIIILGTFN